MPTNHRPCGAPGAGAPGRWRGASLGEDGGAMEQAGREAGPCHHSARAILAGQGIQHRQPRGLGQLPLPAEYSVGQIDIATRPISAALPRASSTKATKRSRSSLAALGVLGIRDANGRIGHQPGRNVCVARAQARMRSSLPGI